MEYRALVKRRGGGRNSDMLGKKRKSNVAIRSKCHESHGKDETARGTLAQV